MYHGLDRYIIETVGHKDLQTMDNGFFQDFQLFLFLKHDGYGLLNEFGVYGLFGSSLKSFLQEKNSIFREIGGGVV